MLAHYIREGVQELDQEKLAPLLKLRYHDSIADAIADLGDAKLIGRIFAGFQKYLYQPAAAWAAAWESGRHAAGDGAAPGRTCHSGCD